MKDDVREPRQALGWALPASAALHALVVAFLIFGLPKSLSRPEKEEAVAVVLVPPPEPPEKAEPKPVEKAKPAPSPPVEKPDPPKPRAEDEPTDREAVQPWPVLRPVFQFGEKDAGPRVSADGNSSGEAKSGAASAVQRQEAGASPDQARNPPEGEASPAPPGAPAERPALEPAPAEPMPSLAPDAGGLEQAKTLYSQAASGGTIATTAIGDLPRDERVGQLCITELNEQLKSAWPPFFPELLPNYVLKYGTVLDVPDAIFPAGGQLYMVHFRCEVDSDATKVVSFALGDPIPRSQWASRGLLAQ